MRLHTLLSVLAVLAAARQAACWREGSSSTLEVLQRLAGGGGGSVMLQQDEPRKGESPIYYLQLPPSPYFYADDSASASVPLPAHHKVDIEFLINGRPGKVYHYSSPLTALHSHYQPQPPPRPSPPPQPSPPPVPPLLTTTSPPLSTSPAGPTPSKPSLPPSPQKPYIRSQLVLKKKFTFNGKPTKVYVWRNGSPLTVKNHRRALQPFRF